MIVAVRWVVTTVVETVTLADVLPAGTVTLAGTLATVEFDASVTAAPSAGAVVHSDTVAVEELGPTAELGDSDNRTAAAGSTVNVTVLDAMP